MPSVRTFLQDWLKRGVITPPPEPTELQTDLAELLAANGVKVDPRSIYPVSMGETTAHTPAIITTHFTFDHEQYDKQQGPQDRA